MRGFGQGVDGHYEVADQLSRYLRYRANEQLEAEREAKQAIDTRQEEEARAEQVREAFLDTIGGLPDTPDDLSVERTDTLQRDGYRIELLTFESRPDFHVTANCYVPAEEGPHPGVLFLSGHVPQAKAARDNQKACAELALNGFVVLATDPVSQGERRQYDAPSVNQAVVSSGVFGHSYAGQGCYYAGANLARFMINDARCGLEYLIDRPDVDADRIGVAGTSGGGTQATYLSLVDDRIDAAVLCCCLSSRREWVKSGKNQDAEANLHGAIPRGLDFDDLVAAAAPRPICIGAATSDFFPIEGAHDSYERIREVYERYDAAEDAELVVHDGTHASVYEFGPTVFEWLCEQLDAGEYVPHDELQVAEVAELHSTPDGSVREAYPDERTIDDLVREYVESTYPDGGSRPAVDDPGAYAEQVRERLVERFDLDRERCDLYPRHISRRESDGLVVDHVFFKSERDPDVVVTGVLVSDPDADAGTPAVVLFEDGTEELAERSEEVASLAAEYGTVFVFDPRGVGAVRNRPLSTYYAPDREGYYDVYGTEMKHAYDALMLGTPLFGMRVYDVLRAVEFLRAETGCERVALVGEGIGASHALYAGAADPDVERIECRGLGPSFHERATSSEHPFEPRLTVYDVIGDCDVPHLLAALDDRDVRVVDDREAQVDGELHVEQSAD